MGYTLMIEIFSIILPHLYIEKFYSLIRLLVQVSQIIYFYHEDYFIIITHNCNVLTNIAIFKPSIFSKLLIFIL